MLRKLPAFIILVSVAILNKQCNRNPYVTTKDYDIVILNGRVIDPESNLDAVRNIAIKEGSVHTITEKPIKGKTTINAGGLVVAPGFIDMHQHGQDKENCTYKVLDGVTTALELEMGTADVDKWYMEREGQALINYGVSVGHVPLRMEIMHDPGGFAPVGDAVKKEASDAEILVLGEGIEKGLTRGALGVGFGLMYTPAATKWEILEMFRIAGKYKVPCYVHMRYGGLKEPNNCITALEEVISASAITGAPLHVVHITSLGFSYTPRLLQMIKEANLHGIDVSAECYPYSATQTTIESAVYDEGWQESFGITYSDLQWAETGERLNAESFARYRKSGGMVIAHSIPDEVVESTVADPKVIIASDGILTEGKGHPRGTGTFARVLGKYVREEKLMSLNEGLSKITLMPAKRLEKIAPAFKKKGRICVGADADITIFDPENILDQATYEEPAKYSRGISYVIVNGNVIVRNGQLLEDIYPGKPLRGTIK
ncbi:MAG TPA: D-glutamate deacylase [Bacteroidales bacterium]|nr:D-glutamate deacylase [Bacteroidales bacterium]HBZ21896.1 D-glutamate deacylase [Bacteroidales bacterium]